MDGPLAGWVRQLLQKVEEQGHPLPTKFVLNDHPAHLLSVINSRADQVNHIRLLPGSRDTLLNVATALGLHHQSTSNNDDEEQAENDDNEDDENENLLHDTHLQCEEDECTSTSGNGSQKQNDQANQQRRAFQKEHRATTIKCMLKKRLSNPDRDLPLLDELVGHVSACARVGSERFNAWLLHHLATSSHTKPYGKLPDDIEIGTTKYLLTIVLPCFRDTQDTLPEDIASIPNVQLIASHPGRIQGDKQSITYAAQQYITSFRNHVRVNFFKRVYRFCKLFCHARGLRRGSLYNATSLMYTTVMERRQDYSLDPFLVAVPHMSKMIQIMRSWVDGTKRGRQHTKFKYMVEALFMMNVHHMVHGRKMWSVAPIHRLSRIHVCIDPVVWQHFFAPRHKSIGVYKKTFNYSNLTIDDCSEHLMAIFNRNLHTLRSSNMGWNATSSFKTDGYSLCVTFFNEHQFKTSKRGRGSEDESDDEIIDVATANSLHNAQFLGSDAGEVNAATMAGFRDGVPWVRTLHTKGINILSGKKGFHEQQKRRVKNVQSPLDALSAFGTNGHVASVKTPSLDQQANYIRASSTHANTFRQTLGHKHVCRAKMAVYGGQCRVIDDFLNSLPIYRNRPIVVAYGAANWAPIAAGDRPPAPRTLVYKRMKLWADLVKMTDEYYTTKKQFVGRGIGLDIRMKGRTTVMRGLKGDATHKALSQLTRSQLPHGTAFAMVEVIGENTCSLCADPTSPTAIPCVLMSRDGNAALNIRECLARGGHRPKYLRRA